MAEIRRPKTGTRSKAENRNLQMALSVGPQASLKRLCIRFSAFGFLSDFGLRISDLASNEPPSSHPRRSSVALPNLNIGLPSSRTPANDFPDLFDA
jgi:hypothetical protein